MNEMQSSMIEGRSCYWSAGEQPGEVGGAVDPSEIAPAYPAVGRQELRR